MIDWQTVETVMLDMDGTLLDLHYDNFFWLTHLPQQYAVANNMELAYATRHLEQLIAAERGSLNWYCIDFWSEKLDLDIVSLKTDMQDRIQFLPHAENLLAYLDTLPVKTLLVTNAHRKVLDVKDKVTAITGLVDRAWSSHDLGLPKEDANFWPALAKVENFNPKTTVFIDDNAAVLDSALQYNIKYLIKPLRPDSQALQQAKHLSNKVINIESLDELFETPAL